jgi:hypothetical protein
MMTALLVLILGLILAAVQPQAAAAAGKSQDTPERMER